MNVVFFDGYCNLCNHWVDWLLRHDHAQRIQFASLQGESARRLLPAEKVQNVDTIVYLRNGEVFLRSTAVLRILGDLGGPWRILRVGLVIPAFLRDFGYRLLAKSRYRWFGKRDSCRLPTPEERRRFLP